MFCLYFSGTAKQSEYSVRANAVTLGFQPCPAPCRLQLKLRNIADPCVCNEFQVDLLITLLTLSIRSLLACSGVCRPSQRATVHRITTADALCLILHMSWKNNEQARRWSERWLARSCGCMWNVGLEKARGGERLFLKTSISILLLSPCMTEYLWKLAKWTSGCRLLDRHEDTRP